MKYSDMLTTAVGPKQYRRLAEAMDFYRESGFQYVDVPWLVQQKVDHATKPKHVKPIHHHVSALNHTFHFAASGEQSFIQMQYNAHKVGAQVKGRLQTITPCFRDELDINEFRRIGFMKLELIDWDNTTEAHLDWMVETALDLFHCYIPCRVVPNDLVDENGVDIVSKRHGIELGSYGIREAAVGEFRFRWIYGTGLAEPRLSVAIQKERE